MLTLQNTEAIRRIEEAIGYTFNDKRLLIQVLTRKTYLKIDPEAPDNEVLEFYGDTLMNYHVTNYFMSKYAHMLDDGLFFMRTVEQFTDMRSHYVCNRYLTDRIKAMGLARYLRAQNRDSELRRDGEKAYADIFESLVGAIYLDSYQNDNLIRAFILRQLGIEPKRLPDEIESFDYDSLTAPAAMETPALEEPESLTDLPAEDTLETAEPVRQDEVAVAAPVVVVEDAPAVVAETVVAEPSAIPIDAPVAVSSVAEVPVEEKAVVRIQQDALAEFCRRWGFDQPIYGETPPNAPNARPVAACTMKYKDAKGKLVKISLNDSGRTLAEATEKAAAKMLKKLEKQTMAMVEKVNKAAESSAEAPHVEEVPAQAAEASVVEAIAPVIDKSVDAAVSADTSANDDTAPAEPIRDEISSEAEGEETAVSPEPISESAVSAETANTAPATLEPELVAEPVAVMEEPVLETVTETVADTQESSVTDSVTDTVPVEEFIQQTMELNMEDVSVAEEAPVEEVKVAKPVKNTRKKKAETADGEGDAADVKTAKPKRAPAKKKAVTTDESPAEETPAVAAPAEPEQVTVAEVVDEVPSVKAVKPRARKPRTKKTAEEPAAPSEGGQTETA